AERVRQKPEDPVKTAQALQHIEEMSGGNWKKIDERYREFAELLDKGGVKLGDDKIALAHERGIQAARNLGNLGDAKERYEAAGQLDGAEKIGQTIGIVSLKVSPSEVSGEEILKPSLMPFDPTLRNNISVAQAALQERGSYQGSLPVGTYDFGGQTLQVESGGEDKMRG
ncbi:hypothetical protein HN680_07335, partial [Candidatus Peregrinibacteria bacterium]|nr:hypothetical protein [Candidatus Peregrinibacteria bacterium]